MKIVLVSAVALVDLDGRVLLSQRPQHKQMGGLWEFPGGKVENNESPESALIREIKEEIGIDIRSSCLAPLTFASHAYKDFHLLMPLFVCRKWEGIPFPKEDQLLKWMFPKDMKDLKMPAADSPLISILRDWI